MADDFTTVEQVDTAIKGVREDGSLSDEKKGEALLPLYQRKVEIENGTPSTGGGVTPLELIDEKIAALRKENESLQPGTMAYDRFATQLSELYRQKVAIENDSTAGKPPEGAPEFADLQKNLGIARTQAVGEALSELFPDAPAAARFAVEMGLSPAHNEIYWSSSIRLSPLRSMKVNGSSLPRPWPRRRRYSKIFGARTTPPISPRHKIRRARSPVWANGWPTSALAMIRQCRCGSC